MESARNNYAVLIDLENAGGKGATLTSIIDRVKLRGNILIGRVYGYSDRFADLKEVLLSNTFQAVPSIRHGYNQKNNLDIQLVIDALDVAYTNSMIDCFCLVSGDSDFTPLVGKLKSMGKYVLGISRSEVASKIFINACNEFVFLESVSAQGVLTRAPEEAGTNDLRELAALLEKIVTEKSDESGAAFASEVKNTLIRLRPDFSERNYGFTSFGKLLTYVSNTYGTIHITDINNTIKIGLVSERALTPLKITKENWLSVLSDLLADFKSDGFERVNPGILKNTIQNEYPDFDEKQLGFKKFSDILKVLEKNKKVKLEFDEAHTMLIKII